MSGEGAVQDSQQIADAAREVDKEYLKSLGWSRAFNNPAKCTLTQAISGTGIEKERTRKSVRLKKRARKKTRYER